MNEQRYKVVIAEDDIHQLSLLKNYASEMDLDIVSTVSSGVRLVEEVKVYKPDILLLDIGLKKKDGITAYKEILNAGLRPVLIFVTGSLDPSHLLAGFDLQSIDYLTKPIQKHRFERAIQKAKESIYAKKLLDAAVDHDIHFIRLRQNYREITVAENQIVFVEKDKLFRNRYNVHLRDRSVVETSTHLKEIKEMCKGNLVYTHRSYLVNVLYIISIQPDDLFPRNYTISLEHTDEKVPLTKKNYHNASDIFSKFRTQVC